MNQWLEMKPNHQTCQVCRGCISRDKVIPLYSRGNSIDPRTKAAPRPEAQRLEPRRPQGPIGYLSVYRRRRIQEIFYSDDDF